MVFGLIFTGYAATVFDEPKVLFSGDSGMSSADQQYIDKKLKDLENLINSRLAAMENRVNTQLQNSRGLFTDTIGSRGCPAGYHFVYVATNSGGYYATRLRTCFRGTSYTPDGGSEGGNHD